MTIDSRNKYGLIGSKLGHSFSQIIHQTLATYAYELWPLDQGEFQAFMESKNFAAINVTIPYKQAVIPYLDHIHPNAQAIGAVNTIVNRAGKLWGYNTDFDGLAYLLATHNINLTGKKVVILGTGGTAKTATAVAKQQKAQKVCQASRNPATNSEIVGYGSNAIIEAEVIINTTPCGMYPNNYSQPLDLKICKNLQAVIDVIYNPLKTQLILQAIDLGLTAVGGLEMLVAQAKFAAELFLDAKIANSKIQEVYQQLLQSQSNLVLIAMPCAGKTTLGQGLAKELSKKFVDTDQLVTQQTGQPITEIFAQFGETRFRQLEQDQVQTTAQEHGLVIATGGGVIKNLANIQALKQNGLICFIDRDPRLLAGDATRPLASTKNQIKQLYQERYPIYLASCNFKIDNNGSTEAALNQIKEKFYENLGD